MFNEQGELLDIAQQEFEQIYPKSGWVEHDPEEILKTQFDTLAEIISRNNIPSAQIAGIGITNQRETTIVWDKNTGKSIYNAIVWQDRRTAPICEDIKEKGLAEYVKQTTGLIVDSYFSGSKIKWLLDNIEGAREKAENGELLFGTVDTWLLWNLTDKKVHATDYSNASRTMLYNIKNLKWDGKILEELEIPSSMLPEVKSSGYHFGDYELDGVKVPIAGIAGDQQAALFGQACFEKGMAKNTYGTGCFLLMNTGEEIQYSENGLLTTIAWGLDDKVYYALEGSVFIAGASVQWLRDGLRFFDSASESEKLALEVEDTKLRLCRSRFCRTRRAILGYVCARGDFRFDAGHGQKSHHKSHTRIDRLSNKRYFERNAGRFKDRTRRVKS